MNVEYTGEDLPSHQLYSNSMAAMDANLKRAEKNPYVSITYKIRALAADYYRRNNRKPSKLFISVNLGDNLIVEMLTEHPEVAYAASGKANVAFSFEGMKIYRVVEPDCVEVA